MSSNNTAIADVLQSTLKIEAVSFSETSAELHEGTVANMILFIAIGYNFSSNILTSSGKNSLLTFLSYVMDHIGNNTSQPLCIATGTSLPTSNDWGIHRDTDLQRFFDFWMYSLPQERVYQAFNKWMDTIYRAFA
jgi:hypothetical protein